MAAPIACELMVGLLIRSHLDTALWHPVKLPRIARSSLLPLVTAPSGNLPTAAGVAVVDGGPEPWQGRLDDALFIRPPGDSMKAHRPTIMGTRHMIAATQYLAAEAGFKILEAGGNAIDAGVAAGIALGVV